MTPEETDRAIRDAMNQGHHVHIPTLHECDLASKDHEIARLREALENLTGICATPLFELRYKGDAFALECVQKAKDALNLSEQCIKATDYELRPIERAAELGCPDFASDVHGLGLVDPANAAYTYPLPNKSKRINRFAADVCECWWSNQSKINRPKRVGKSTIVECYHMMDLCATFRKKFGDQ